MVNPELIFLSIESNDIEISVPEFLRLSMIFSVTIRVGDVIPIEKTAKKATDANSSSTVMEMIIIEKGEWYFICYCFEFIILLDIE